MPNNAIMIVKKLADFLQIAQRTVYLFASNILGFKAGSARGSFTRERLPKSVINNKTQEDKA